MTGTHKQIKYLVVHVYLRARTNTHTHTQLHRIDDWQENSGGKKGLKSETAWRLRRFMYADRHKNREHGICSEMETKQIGIWWHIRLALKFVCMWSEISKWFPWCYWQSSFSASHINANNLNCTINFHE